MSKIKEDSTTMIDMVCAIIFITFVFLYVFCYQADLLTLAQHAWSGGKTTFVPIVGAPLFCSVLLLIRYGVKSLFPLPPYIKSLTYFPSLLFLGVLTSVSPENGENLSVGHWSWISILLLILYFIIAKSLTELTTLNVKLKNTSLLSRIAWCNYIILVMLFSMTVAIGNNDLRLHRDMHAESLLNQRRYTDVLDYERTSSHTDSTLFMFRALALSKQNALGESLFAYPVPSEADKPSLMLVPHSDGSCKFTFADEGILWRQLGAMPQGEIKDVRKFLLSLRHTGVARPAVNDYLLCSYLLDRDLNGFVKELSSQIDTVRIDRGVKGKELDILLQRKTDVLNRALAKLPRHYREALVLYNHINSTRIITYSDEVLDADYRDFYALEQKKLSPIDRKSSLDAYSGTYWLYYTSE